MKIGRVIAITAAVCAVIGMATQAEAAKRKAGNPQSVPVCVSYDWRCSLFIPVMADFAGNRYVFNPPGRLLPYTPYRVLGRKSGDTSLGSCKVTQVDVLQATQIGPTGNCPVNLR